MTVNRPSDANPLRRRAGCIDLDPEWPGPDGKPRGPRLCVLYPKCECGKEDRVMTERSQPAQLPSNPSNAVRAGNAFVARFKREPVSSSDAAWLNGYVIALEGNAHETGEQEIVGYVPYNWTCNEWDKGTFEGYGEVLFDLSNGWEWRPVYGEKAPAPKANEGQT